MIAAVTFDFWNTLVHIPPRTMSQARHQAVSAACADCGVEVGEARLGTALEEVGLRYQRFWEEGRHLHPDESAEMLTRAIGVEGVARERVAEAFLGAGRNTDLAVTAPGLEPCLRTLHKRGVRLGIVCDVVFMRGEALRELLADLGLLTYFSGWGFSDEVGCYKPAPKIFEAALESLQVRPQEALHVGDLKRTDVAGGASLGMKTSRYRGIHDDPEDVTGVEAEFVIDDYVELTGIVERLR